MKRYLLFIILIVMLPLVGFSQGKTSSAIQGIVKDSQGQPLPGANIVAIDQPSGTRYGTATRPNGRYTIKNVQPGGPYVIQVTFVGYNAEKKQIATIKLGDVVTLNFQLEEGSLSLNEISVTAQANTIFNTERTGAKTNISREDIDRTPNLSRSLSTYTELVPQSTGGSSFGGANNRYNNILVDGATLNDVFGLSSSGTPGGQAGVSSPISIDAIKEFNVDIAPFDVTNNNFNGAQINAITRSGTNTFTGSAYFQLRNAHLEGNYELVQGNGQTSPDASNFDEKFYGIRLGGPIIKNKLFFFVNGELKRQSTPLNAGILGSGQGNIFPADQGLFDDLSNIFQNQYGYNPGNIAPLGQSTDNNKLLAKIDWNINDQNKFSLRYNYVDATDEQGISRSAYSYDFSNRQYDFNSTQNSLVAELNSNFGNNASNTFRAVATRIRDSRDVVDQRFPQVDISLSIANQFRDINAGIDRFSQANSLGQNLYELTDNFSYIKGNNEFTLGTSNQFYHFNNLFVQDAYGAYTFRSVDDFKVGKPYEYQYSYLLPGGKPRAQFDAYQLGFYAQDKWTATDRLTITGGLRVDIPFLPDSPTYNPNAQQAFGYNTTNVASGNILWSPRLGFNWDASRGEHTTQVRGGVGIFSGPPPFVWLSNQYSNTGVDYGRVDFFDADSAFFSPDPDNQPSPLNSGSPLSGITTSEVDLVSKDFKYPQSLKADLAIDHELPGGIIGTLEGIYTKEINAVVYRNLNLQQVGNSDVFPNGETIYGRPIYGDVYYDSYYQDAAENPNLVDPQNFTDAILLDNTNKGYRYSITGELQKRFDSGFRFDVSYTYNRATDVTEATSSRAISNWTYNMAADVNNPRLGTASFERRSRVLGKLSYQFNYGQKGSATTISLIYDGHSGSPYSWVYNGNANADRGDGRFENDLVYVPRSSDDVVVASDNYGALDAFINDHPSLDKYRGEIVPRGTARSPWTNFLDLRVNQKIGTVAGQNVEFTASMFNVLNFISQRWGKQRFVNYNEYGIWTIRQYVDQDYLDNNPDLNLDSGDIGKPVIFFDPSNGYDSNIYQTNDVSSRWRLQVGVRYNF